MNNTTCRNNGSSFKELVYFLVWLLIWSALVFAYFSLSWEKLLMVSCERLPNWLENKINMIYDNLDTERVNREIEVKCN